MKNYNVFRPAYTAGSEAYQSVAAVCEPYGKKVVVVGGRTAVTKVKTMLTASLAFSTLKLVDFVWYGGTATRANAERLAAHKSVKKADMVFAVGGGQALDTCKAAADLCGKPVFVFPTVASSCAASTALSVLYTATGETELYFCKKAPEHIFLNTEIIAQAPRSFLWAAIADTMLSHAEQIFAQSSKQMEPAKHLGEQLSRHCKFVLEEVGEAALADCDRNTASKALERAALCLTVTAGAAFVPLLSGLRASVSGEEQMPYYEVLHRLVRPGKYTDAQRLAACEALHRPADLAAAVGQ